VVLGHVDLLLVVSPLVLPGQLVLLLPKLFEYLPNQADPLSCCVEANVEANVEAVGQLVEADVEAVDSHPLTRHQFVEMDCQQNSTMEVITKCYSSLQQL